MRSFNGLGASLVAQMVKNPPAMRETWGSIPGLGRSPGGVHGNPLQYSCLGNPTDRGAWQAPWGHNELERTERLTLSLSVAHFSNHICLSFGHELNC